MRIIIPPTGNQFIGMLKTTSLLFTIAVPEIFAQGTNIYTVNFRYFEVLCVVSIWYLALTTVLTLAQRRLERRVGLERARLGGAGQGLLSRLFGAGAAREAR